MNVPARITVTAAEFTRQFGQLRHGPDDRPVHITHHGRPTHVLIGADRYETMRRDATGAAGVAMPDLATFAAWLDIGVFVLDQDGVVMLANAAAHGMFDVAPDALCGRLLWDAAPALTGSLLDGHLRHAMRSRTGASADLPSPTLADRWLQVAIHPAARATTILLRDITRAVREERLADAPAALALAVAANPAIARLELNPRGHIALADPVFCDWIGLPEGKLDGVGIVDLAPAPCKPELRMLLDRVLSGDGPATLATELLTNAGRTLPVVAALAELRGAYGQCGAVMLLTAA